MHYPFNEIKTILKLPHQKLKSPSFIYDVTLITSPICSSYSITAK